MGGVDQVEPARHALQPLQAVIESGDIAHGSEQKNTAVLNRIAGKEHAPLHIQHRDASWSMPGDLNDLQAASSQVDAAAVPDGDDIRGLFRERIIDQLRRAHVDRVELRVASDMIPVRMRVEKGQGKRGQSFRQLLRVMHLHAAVDEQGAPASRKKEKPDALFLQSPGLIVDPYDPALHIYPSIPLP